MSGARIPFTDVRLAEESAQVQAAIERVIRSGWYVLGPEVEAFEQEFAAASGVAHAVGTGNGTDALAIILRALGIGPGDEVITTPFSAAYTALAIVMAGATPVFADIDDERLTLDPAAAERAITPRTAGLMPVHLYGQPADMTALSAVAAKHGLALIEDCCQAHVATCDGTPVGRFGAAGAFSFYPTKNLGALGDGGAVVTGDAALAARMKRIRNGGQSDRYLHTEPGVNSRLDEMQAAILRSRLPWLRRRTDQRRALAARYRSRLADAPVRVPLEVDPGHVYHLFPVRTASRSTLQAHLRSAGIETLIHYPVPIPQQPAFGPAASAGWPVAEAAANQVVSLPLYPALSMTDVDSVSEAIRAFAGNGEGKERAS
jgi:UDP-N-acetyl-3-dehydro-alpha-D-glucosamine 3-aminotranferase